MNTSTLLEAGQVTRWHTWPTHKSQNLAEHSWGVAMLIMAIRPTMDSPQLLKAALTHDLHEVEAGDIPYPFKKNNQLVRRAYADQELAFNQSTGIHFQLDKYDTHCLKWADMMELYVFSKREFSMGNAKMARTMTVASNALRDMGHPNELAEKLFKEML